MRKKIVLAVIALVAAAAMAGTASAQLAGSKHDLSTLLSIANPCQVCHVPHPQLATPSTYELLWNRPDNTAATYDPYTSSTITAINNSVAPAGVSLLCLSCHDDTQRLDASGGAAPVSADVISTITPTDPAANLVIGEDLTNDHPVSISYQAALTNPSKSGEFQTVATVTTVLKLFGSAGSETVQCASCHDPHEQSGTSGVQQFLRDTPANICTNCHIK